MPKLQPFNADAKCPKCRSDQVGSIWRPVRDQRGPSERWDNDAPDQECIERHCQRCHFEWWEKPLDRVPVVETAKP
jgi:hypothetical protein